MNPPLEPEVQAALQHAGIRPRSFVRISNLYPTGTERSTYRIEHDRGTVKARRLEDEAVAQELTALRSELPDAFAPVILRHGRVLIEAWIDGEALPDVPRPHHLAAAGALLAELHAKPRLGDRKLHGVCSTAHQLQLAQHRLRTVVAAGALGAERGRAARARSGALGPASSDRWPGPPRLLRREYGDRSRGAASRRGQRARACGCSRL